jgi:hypothetical protein
MRLTRIELSDGAEPPLERNAPRPIVTAEPSPSFYSGFTQIREAERYMTDRIAGEVPTSTATTPETELEVQAAISSAEGNPELEQAIRERAYAIWEEEGRLEGRDLDHWLRAKAEIEPKPQES